MKIRIEEQHPGEFEERAEDAVKVLEKLAGRSLLPHDHIDRRSLSKADEPVLPHQTKAQWEYPAIKGSYDRRSKEADRIARLMQERLLSVLE